MLDFFLIFRPIIGHFSPIFVYLLTLEQKCDADMSCGLLIERVYGAEVFFAPLGAIFGPFGGIFGQFGCIFSVFFAIFVYLLTLE